MDRKGCSEELTDPVGRLLCHYEVGALLGEGGMGRVYRALDTRLHREVALKMLPPELAGDARHVARFRREAQVIASLNHPHIATIYGSRRSTAGSFRSRSWSRDRRRQALPTGQSSSIVPRRVPVDAPRDDGSRVGGHLLSYGSGDNRASGPSRSPARVRRMGIRSWWPASAPARALPARVTWSISTGGRLCSSGTSSG